MITKDLLNASMTFQTAGLVGNVYKKRKKPVRSAIDAITGISLLKAEGSLIADL